MLQQITPCVQDTIDRLTINGKVGKSLLQPKIAEALRNAGYIVDCEDKRLLLSHGMPVWRDKQSNQIEPTKGRRAIDIVLYSGSDPVALIEIESDLNDLKEIGVSRRNGHYDVNSIAQSADGTYFASYKSIERMAAASYYMHLSKQSNKYPDAETAVSKLQAIRSNDPIEHNPQKTLMILVSGSCRASDQKILRPRLSSLGMTLICAKQR